MIGNMPLASSSARIQFCIDYTITITFLPGITAMALQSTTVILPQTGTF
jgi:hypothetical protein